MRRWWVREGFFFFFQPCHPGRYINCTTFSPLELQREVQMLLPQTERSGLTSVSRFPSTSIALREGRCVFSHMTGNVIILIKKDIQVWAVGLHQHGPNSFKWSCSASADTKEVCYFNIRGQIFYEPRFRSKVVLSAVFEAFIFALWSDGKKYSGWFFFFF